MLHYYHCTVPAIIVSYGTKKDFLESLRELEKQPFDEIYNTALFVDLPKGWRSTIQLDAEYKEDYGEKRWTANATIFWSWEVQDEEDLKEQLKEYGCTEEGLSVEVFEKFIDHLIDWNAEYEYDYLDNDHHLHIQLRSEDWREQVKVKEMNAPQFVSENGQEASIAEGSILHGAYYWVDPTPIEGATVVTLSTARKL
jgi:chorismate mutase